MIVYTKNSTYEISNGMIRAVKTKHTERYTGITDNFQKFSDIFGPTIGRSMIIFWPIKGGDVYPLRTTTSKVIEIDEDLNLGWTK